MTLRVFLVLIFGFVAVFGLPQFRRHRDHHDHHDRHHHEEFDHHHDIHHGGQHYDGHHHIDHHHEEFYGHHDHRFRRSSGQDALNLPRKARHLSGGFDSGFDAPYESFGKHGNHQGYKLRGHGQRKLIHGKKTEFSSSSAIAKSISTPYGTRTISKTHAHSAGTIVSKAL